MSAYMQIYRVIPNSCKSKGKHFSLTHLKSSWGKYSRRAVKNIIEIAKDVNGDNPATMTCDGESCITVQEVRGAYRQGFFFKRRWLFGKTTLYVATSPRLARLELSKIMALNRRKYNYESAVEAYRFMTSRFEELVAKDGAKYFMLVAF